MINYFYLRKNQENIKILKNLIDIYQSILLKLKEMLLLVFIQIIFI